MRDRSLLRNLLYTHLGLWRAEQEINDSFRPVRPISQKSEIAERLFGTAELSLLLAKLVGKFNQ